MYWKIDKKVFTEALAFWNKKSGAKILAEYFLLRKNTLTITDAQSAIILGIESDNEENLVVPIRPIKELFKKSKTIIIEKNEDKIIATTDKGTVSKIRIQEDPEMFAKIPILFDSNTPKIKIKSKDFIKILKTMKDTIRNSVWYDGGIFFIVKNNILDVFATNRTLLKYFRFENIESNSDMEFILRLNDIKKMLKVKYKEDVEIYITKDIIYFIVKDGIVVMNTYNGKHPDFWEVYDSVFNAKKYSKVVLSKDLIDFIVNFLKTLDKNNSRVKIEINENGIKLLSGIFNTEIENNVDIEGDFKALLKPQDLLNALSVFNNDVVLYCDKETDLKPIGLEDKSNFKAMLMTQKEEK